jgi:hypothetical protein
VAPDWVAKRLDVIEHISFGLFSAVVDPAFNALSLEKLEEALDHSVFVTVASPTLLATKLFALVAL